MTNYPLVNRGRARLTEHFLQAADPALPVLTDRKPHHLAGRPSNNRHTPENFARRFWRKVQIGAPDDCWLWKGNKVGTGRGQVHLRWEGTKNIRAVAPRVAWELTNGPIPPGLFACHRCDVPACVNPAHLFLGTQLDNVRDAIAKGRYPWTRTAKSTPEQLAATALPHEVTK